MPVSAYSSLLPDLQDPILSHSSSKLLHYKQVPVAGFSDWHYLTLLGELTAKKQALQEPTQRQHKPD